MTMRWKVALVEDDRRLARAVSVGLDLAELTADVLRAYASQADTLGVGLVKQQFSADRIRRAGQPAGAVRGQLGTPDQRLI